MASISYNNPAVDRVNSTTTAFGTSSSDPYVFDCSLPSPDSCDSVLGSPCSPVLDHSAYRVPNCKPDVPFKPDTLFNYGNFEDWMGWDELDPEDSALSPTLDFFPSFKAEPLSPGRAGMDLDRITSFESDRLGEEPLFSNPPPRPLPIASQANTYYRPAPSTNSSFSAPPRGAGNLTEGETARLCAIAMPSYLQNNIRPEATSQYPDSPSSSSSPEPTSAKRRKTSTSFQEDYMEDSETDEIETSSRRGKPIKKTAHNMIEKRYRTNLNDKIAALRDSVPSLRVVTKKNSRGEEIEEDLEGLTPAHKLNKATVLAKATEYIAHLEKRNRALAKENAGLKSRVEAFEILMTNKQGPSHNMGRMPGGRQ